MNTGTQFRFTNFLSYQPDEHFTVIRTGDDWLTCFSNKRPDTTHFFGKVDFADPFPGRGLEYRDDAMMAAANAIANTPLGEYIDFSRTAQEL